MATSMADLGFNIDSSPMRQASRELDRMSKGAGRAEKSTAGLARAANVARIAVASLGAVVGGLGVSRLIRETTDFDSAMRRLQATSQATGDQMAQLEKQARTLGATTIFSAKETADAQQFLAMAGFEVNKIMAATPSVLKLATAANMGLAQAADIASNVLGGMRLEVSQLDRVIDVMASTTSGSNTNIQQLGTALAYAAPLAASAGIEIEEVAAAIGTLSDAGVQGSRAGTGLVGVIRQLSNVTPDAEKALNRYGITLSEVDITTRGLAPVLRTLREANISTSDAFKVFGSEAGAAAQILASGSERVREFAEELGNSEGSADAMARTIGGGLAGSWASFNSALSESILRLGRDQGVASGFQSVVDTATGVISVYNDMLPQFAEANDLTDEQVEGLESQAAMLKTVTFGLGAVATVYGTVAVATRAATAAQVAFNLAARANPYILIASSVAAAAAAIYSFTGAQESAIAVWERAKGSEAAYQAALADVGAANRIQEIAAERLELQQRLEDAQGRWIRNGTEEEAIQRRLVELEREYHQITDARIEAEKAANDRRKEAREAESEALKMQVELQQQQQAAADAAAKAERDSVIDQIDLLRERLGLLKEGTVEFRKNVGLVKEAVAAGVITKDQAAEIVRVLGEAGEDSGEEFVNEWQSVADRVAQSLQDAIASGDWDKLGDAIGNALAASIAGVVNKTITDSLAKDLTANSSTLAQIGGAFAGPIAGAVAGGAIQLAVSELSDFFSGSDWDPTADRQARQGTGTVLGSIYAKSQSIANATDSIMDSNKELVNINTGMLRSLQSLQVGMSGATAMVLRQLGGADLSVRGGAAFGLSDAQVRNAGGLGVFGGVTGMISEIPVIGDLFGGLADGFMGVLDDITGGLLSGIGSSLFGSKKKVDEGIKILGGSIADLIVDTQVQAYATIRKKGSLFGGSGYRRDKTADLVTDQFTYVFQDMYDSIEQGALALGLLPAEVQASLDAFVVETQKISLEDLDAAQQQAEIEAVLGSIFDNVSGAVVPFIDELQRAGEGLGETLARVATNVQIAQEGVAAIGFSDVTGRMETDWSDSMNPQSEYVFRQLDPEAYAKAATALTQGVGGAEAFSRAIVALEDNFLTEAERFENRQRRLGEALGDVPLPETREGYLELIRAQNIGIAADRERLATLLRLEGVANDYYDTVEDRAEEALRAERDRLNELRGLASDAFSDLQASIRAERNAATESYNEERDAIQQATDARLEANRIAIDAATQGLNAIQEEVRGIDSALEQLRGAFDPIQAMRRQNALGLLRGALSSGDLSGTGEAADIASQIDSAGFATRADFEREQGRTLNLLSDVSELGAGQLSTAEQALESLEAQTQVIRRSGDAQIRALEQAHREEMGRLDDELDAARNQLNALDGIDSSIISVVDAIQEMSSAVVSALGSIDRPASEAGEEANRALIEAVYNQVLGRRPDADGLEYWLDELATGAITYDQLEQAIRNAAHEDGTANGPGAGSPSGGGSAAPDPTPSPDPAPDLAKPWENKTAASIMDLPEGAPLWHFRQINEAYQDLLGRYVGEEGLTYWSQQLANGLSVLDMRRAIKQSEEYLYKQVNGFANGGLHAGGLRIVGERGPEIEATGASRIMSNGDLMKSLGANTELLAEMRKMREDLKAANRALVKSNEKQRELLQRWDQAGLPEERAFV